MSYRVDLSSSVPPARQIVEAVLDAVAAGVLAPAARLLSVRALAAEALVNPNTAARAYRDLESLGVVEGRNGLGVFVTDRGPAVARGLRKQATLEAFSRAAAEALGAGHTIDALLGQIEGVRHRRRATRERNLRPPGRGQHRHGGGHLRH